MYWCLNQLISLKEYSGFPGCGVDITFHMNLDIVFSELGGHIPPLEVFQWFELSIATHRFVSQSAFHFLVKKLIKYILY